MTLVAAFEVENVPILVGDARITDRQNRTLAKKIYRVGPNFVVGWAGSQFAADLVLKGLYEKFHGSWVRKADVEGVLTSFATGDFGKQDVLLTGWIIDEKPECFLFNSGYP